MLKNAAKTQVVQVKTHISLSPSKLITMPTTKKSATSPKDSGQSDGNLQQKHSGSSSLANFRTSRKRPPRRQPSLTQGTSSRTLSLMNLCQLLWVFSNRTLTSREIFQPHQRDPEGCVPALRLAVLLQNSGMASMRLSNP